MNALVTGGSGVVGWNLCRRLRARGVEVVATVNETPAPDGVRSVELDLADAGQVGRLAANSDADVVFHCAALTKTGLCEGDPELARRLNVEATRALIEGLDPKRTMLVFTSTDLVFDGEQGNYSEGDTPNPRMVYGQTKLEAEEVVRTYPGPWAIARLSLVYGAGPEAHPCFLSWVEEGLRGDGATLFSDEIRTAVYIEDVCDALMAIAERRAAGLYHIAGPEPLARDAFGRIFAEARGLDQGKVIAKRQAEVPGDVYRPRDVSLNIAKARRELGFDPRQTRQALSLLQG